MTQPITEATPPLDGLRILDLAGESGAFAGRQLAELGADVIRIEPPAGDPLRGRQPFLAGQPGVERSLHHLHFNAGKRSVQLDLTSSEGAATLRRLAATADALIETADPGAMDALGLGFDALRGENPALLYVTITPFGQDGPLSGYRGDDLIGAATSGLMYLNGLPERPPIAPGAEQAYHMASLVAVSTLLVALLARDRGTSTGGHRIDVSIQEAATMATLQTANANLYAWHREVPRRVGAIGATGRHLYQCADGRWVSFVIPINAPKLWRHFVDWMQHEGVSDEFADERWAAPAFRARHRPRLDDAIERLCARRDRAHIFHEGQRRHMLVMPVNDARDLLEDPHLRERDTFPPVPHPHLGVDLTDARPPYRFSATPTPRGSANATQTRRPAPRLGEHTAAVLAELDALPAVRHPAEGPPAGEPAPEPTAEPTNVGRLLEGIRVADLFWLIAGPATSRILADYGADVIKIESESRIDTIRIVGVQPTNPGTPDTCGVFNDVNTNKRSIQLDLNRPEGIALFTEIVRQSDVLTNNFSGDRMDRWGLGYEQLSKINPRLVMLTMPVFGTWGPYLRYGAYGNGVIAFSGLSQNMGRPDEPPVGIAPLYSDFSAPYTAATAILAALRHRERTGRGQFIELAQVEATINQLGTDLLEASVNRRLPPRLGNRSRDYAPHDAYPCRGDDRWIAISVHDDHEWRRLAALLDPGEASLSASGEPSEVTAGGAASAGTGSPAAGDSVRETSPSATGQASAATPLATDPRFATTEARQAHLDELDRLIAAWTTTRDPWDATRTLQAAGIRAGVVEDLEDMVTRDPHLSGRHLVPLSRPDEDHVFLTHNQPARIDGALPPLRRAPRLGEHNQQIYRDLLAIDEDRYIHLLADGVIR